ncbi:BTAD domain-containing putative transcriptional regulator [Ktedonosporobacter rubrisoli]|uniref:BTAD domain-containing putative transcriptional regulator n=1 Tax=Ktedonosporobacter rubrisoli TaxID=2509675 RepID=UPI0013EEE10A|nr:BTAD domain-containing putative transcriptional regulator [Ktedonosporobacter rubrisoli]
MIHFNAVGEENILPPMQPPVLVPRPHLVNRLEQAIGPDAHPACKVLYILAPAGSGKTALLCDFSQQTRMPCCWYTLTASDTDRFRFLRLLIASIRRQFPDFGKDLDVLIADTIAQPSNQHQRQYQPLISALCDAIQRDISVPFAIILLNFQEVNEDESVIRLVNIFIRQAPPLCRFVFESRVSLNIEITQLIFTQQVKALSIKELRFTAKEIQELAQLRGVKCSEAEAQRLVQTFDGWIAGISLGIGLSNLYSLESERRRVQQKYLFSYLLDEVFAHDPEALAYLQEAAILREMTPDFCNRLLLRSDAETFLQRLEAQGLFVSSTNRAGVIVFTCQPALREILCDRFLQTNPQRFKELHGRASMLWHDASDYEQAIFHAQMAEDHATVLHLILACQSQCLHNGQLDFLIKQIDALPDQVQGTHPRVLLLRIRLCFLLERTAQISALLEQADQAIERWSQQAGAELEAEYSLLRARYLFLAGRYQEARDACLHALALLSEQESQLKGEIYLRLGVCANLLRDPLTGVKEFQMALQAWGSKAVDGTLIDIHRALSMTFQDLGNLPLTSYHLRRATAYCEQMGYERGKIDCLNQAGALAFYQGDYEQSHSVYTQALHLSQGSLRYRLGEAAALSGLGSLAQVRGDYALALTFLEDSLVLKRSLNDHFHVAYTLCNIATIRFLLGDAISPWQLLKEAEQFAVSVPVTDAIEVTCTLTRGQLLLWQRSITEALTCLHPLLGRLQEAGYKKESIRIHIWMAACLLAQKQQARFINHLRAIADIIEESPLQKFTALRELKLLPEVSHSIQSLAEAAQLCALLDLEPALPSDTTAQQGQAVLQITENATHIRAIAFGDAALFIDDQPVKSWRSQRVRELCFFLLEATTPLSKERIIADLWEEDERDIEQIMLNFHSMINRLRNVVGKECVISTQHSYSLDLSQRFGSSVSYDVATFQHYHQLSCSSAQEDDDLRKNLEAMITLYRGAYVQPLYNTWFLRRRSYLQSLYFDARLRLATLTYQLQEYEESAEHSRKILEIEGFNEEAHLRLMLAYARQGRREQALRQYQTCKKLLKEELGSIPGPRLEKLYHQLSQRV